MSNHLIIGLGGTGGKIIRSFRKLIFQQFQGTDAENINLEYLFVDSSKEMMDLDDSSWKILGKSVQLDKHSQMHISDGTDLAAYLENLNNYPGIKGWLGDKEEWNDILNFKKAGEIFGGQKRRLGRFLFACKIQEFRNRVQSLTANMQKQGTTAVTFHICCGLAGGTGSGTIIDAVCQIREMYPDDRIILYTLLPEVHPKTSPPWNSGNYHANGYAALMELNALSAGAWQPHDITGKRERLSMSDPFHGCYLFFNQNESGVSVDVDKDIPDIVADFLFQKLIVVDELRWESLARVENAENHDPAPECNIEGSPERSKRFLTFGLKRLVYPEVEVKEYLSYQFARQAALQMLFNNWEDSLGFCDDPKPIDLSQVNDKITKERWKITEEHVTLSIAILDEEINSRWMTFRADWNHFISKTQQDVRGLNKENWLTELETRCQERFAKSFRQHGVSKFFEIKRGTHGEHAKKIRKILEMEFFKDWNDGTKSLYEIKCLLDSLHQNLDNYLKECDDKIVQYQEQADNTENQNIQPNKVEWSKLGLISELFNKRTNLLASQANALKSYYVSLTYMEAWHFSKALIAATIQEISGLVNKVNDIFSSLTQIRDDFQEGIDKRCQDTDQNDLSRSLVYFYKPDIVKNFSQRLVKDKNIQKNQTMDARATIIQQLGENANFTQLKNRILKQQWLDVIERCCEQAVETAHNTVINTDRDQPRQLDVNLIEKLAKDFSGNEQGLTRYIHNLTKYSGNYLNFNLQEVNKKGVGTSDSPTKIQLFTVIRPESRDWGKFVAQLDRILKGSHDIQPEILQNQTRESEITFVSITGLFPLRYVQHLDFLKEKYDLRLTEANKAGKLDRAKLELHCEGDGCQFPPLYIASEEDVRSEGLPYVLIAHAIGMIKDVKSETTGKSEFYLLSKDVHGFDNKPIPLGGKLTEAANKLDTKNNVFIKNNVTSCLQKDYRHVDKQEELTNKILEIVESVKEECKGDFNDPVYIRFNQAGKQAVKVIKND